MFLASGKVVKKSLFKIWRKGIGKRSKIHLSSMGNRASFFRGGGRNSSLLRGREAGSVFAIKGYKGEVGVCQ